MQSLPFSGSPVPASPVAGFAFLAGKSGGASLDGQSNLPLLAEGGFAALLTAQVTPDGKDTPDDAVATDETLFADEADEARSPNPAETQTWCAALWPFRPAAPVASPAAEINFSAPADPSSCAVDSCDGDAFGEGLVAATDENTEVPADTSSLPPALARAPRQPRAESPVNTPLRWSEPTSEEAPPALSLAFAEQDEATAVFTAPSPKSPAAFTTDTSLLPGPQFPTTGEMPARSTDTVEFSRSELTDSLPLPVVPTRKTANATSTPPAPAAATAAQSFPAPDASGPLAGMATGVRSVAESTAKFTDGPTAAPRPRKPDESAPELKFLNTSDEQLTTTPATLGTGIAKPEPITMSDRRKNAQPHLAGRDSSIESLLSHAVSMVDRASDAAQLTSNSTTSSESPTPTARAVVQQIATVVEAAQTAGEKQPANVKLDFDFGDAQVRVRIEIRDEIVRAHFETDSAELKHTLRTEWQATAAAEPARFSRLAEPVFTAENSATHSGANHAGSGQRESASRQAPQDAPWSSGGFTGHSRRASSVPTLSAPVHSAVHSSRQLHAFA